MVGPSVGVHSDPSQPGETRRHGQLHQKTFSYGGTQRYRAAFAYDTLKRVVANDLFDDLNSQVVQDSWTYDLLGNFQETKTAGVGQQWDASVRFSEPAYIDDLNGNPLEALSIRSSSTTGERSFVGVEASARTRASPQATAS